jgi:hypothetical protein
MMLLIGMAITVAFLASAATTLGWFDLEFWWELAALITIMLLGHWMEMRAIGQARGALAAWAELIPDEAERVADGGTETVSISELAVGDVVLIRPGGRVPADGEIIVGEVEMDESMFTGESKPVAKRPKWWPERSLPTTPSGFGCSLWERTPPWRASNTSSPRLRSRDPGRRCWRTVPGRIGGKPRGMTRYGWREQHQSLSRPGSQDMSPLQ